MGGLEVADNALGNLRALADDGAGVADQALDRARVPRGLLLDHGTALGRQVKHHQSKGLLGGELDPLEPGPGLCRVLDRVAGQRARVDLVEPLLLVATDDEAVSQLDASGDHPRKVLERGPGAELGDERHRLESDVVLGHEHAGRCRRERKAPLVRRHHAPAGQLADGTSEDGVAEPRDDGLMALDGLFVRDAVVPGVLGDPGEQIRGLDPSHRRTDVGHHAVADLGVETLGQALEQARLYNL